MRGLVKWINLSVVGGAGLMALSLALFASCSNNLAGSKPTVADAEKFVAEAEKRYLAASIKDSRASWIQSNFITNDTETIAAEAKADLTKTVKELAEEARKFDGLKLPEDLIRKLKLLKLAVPLPAPGDSAEREELTKIV